jgi:membrane protein DedA with SNARE-associated domain
MAWLAGWITALISAGGYGGVALLMALESACIPIPSELIMPFAGYLASTGRFNLWLVALAGALGCNLGSAAAYWAGARGGRPFVARYGRYMLVSVKDLDSAERFFDRFGAIAVLIGRVLPLIRTFIALPAGIARMRLLPFHAYTFIGSFIWCFALAAIGQQLGRAWNSSPVLHLWMRRLDLLVLAAVAIAMVWFIASHLRRASENHPGE